MVFSSHVALTGDVNEYFLCTEQKSFDLFTNKQLSLSHDEIFDRMAMNGYVFINKDKRLNKCLRFQIISSDSAFGTRLFFAGVNCSELNFCG